MFGKSLFNHLEHLRLQLVSVQFLMIPIAYGIQCRAVHILTFSHCDARLGVMTESNLECDKDIQCILTQRASDETRACPVRFLHSQKLIATTASISTTTTMGPCHNHPVHFGTKNFGIRRLRATTTGEHLAAYRLGVRPRCMPSKYRMLAGMLVCRFQKSMHQSR